jgi:hypothetical protein
MDTFLLASHHNIINLNDATGSQKLSIHQFASILVLQLICHTKKLGDTQLHSSLPEDNILPVVSITAPQSKTNISGLLSPDFASLSEKEIVRASGGYWLLPSASDISFFAKYADESAIGSSALLASAFVDGTYVPMYIRNT